MTQVGDVVLVYVENKPAFFARIESITPDVKPEWFQVKLLVLQVPLVVVTWILREPYINGVEFTMGGRPIRIEKVVAPEEFLSEEAEAGSEDTGEEPAGKKKKKTSGKGKNKGAKVISLSGRMKKKS